MNCEEALSLLYELIDKEVSEIDEKELRKHLDSCGDCYRKYNIEKNLHEFIQARLHDGPVMDAHSKLKMRIEMKLDEIDGEVEDSDQPASDRRTPRPFRFPAVALAAAAAIVILIGTGYFGGRMYTHHEMFVPIEQAHWADQSESSPPMSDSELTSALSQAAGTYNYELRPTIEEYRLVSGHPEELMGQSMLHYVYRNDDSKVSVFLAPAEFFDQYGDFDLEEVVRDNLTLYDHNCRGCRLVFHRVGDVLVITASTDRNVELLDFIPGHVAT
jgi:mycothiol system anti-sigma-R factor